MLITDSSREQGSSAKPSYHLSRRTRLPEREATRLPNQRNRATEVPGAALSAGSAVTAKWNQLSSIAICALYHLCVEDSIALSRDCSGLSRRALFSLLTEKPRARPGLFSFPSPAPRKRRHRAFSTPSRYTLGRRTAATLQLTPAAGLGASSEDKARQSRRRGTNAVQQHTL